MLDHEEKATKPSNKVGPLRCDSDSSTDTTSSGLEVEDVRDTNNYELWFGGESSSLEKAAVVASPEEFQRHSKRIKLADSIRKDYHYTMITSCVDKSNSQGSSVTCENRVMHHTLMSNNDHAYNPICSGGGSYHGNKSETEDVQATMDLGDDLLHSVFSFLNRTDLCGAGLVSRHWRRVSSHEDLWRCLNFEKKNISIDQFEGLCRRYPNATEVNLFATPDMGMLVMRAICSLRNLEALTLGAGYLGATFFEALENCSVLNSLVINDATLGNCEKIIIFHDRLRHLHINNCHHQRISDILFAYSVVIRCPQLQVLSLTRSTMSRVELHCPLLHDLDVSSCRKLSSPKAGLAANCPLLESLDISKCVFSSDKALSEIALTCTSLRSLNASFVSLQAVRFPLLTVLKLHGCPQITSVSVGSIAHCYMLEVLELDKCIFVTSVSLDLPRLSAISFSHCPKFADLNLKTLMLASIAVSDCPLLHVINITSNSLQRLELQKQANLSTLVLQCQSLQELNLPDCDHLERVSFSPVALRSLNLGVCQKLKKVEVKAPNMEVLEMKGCRSLSQAYFDCPLLSSLDASFCSYFNDECLSATTAACPMIESIIFTLCHSVGSKGTYPLRMLTCLTYLDLSYTFLEDLHPIFQSCVQLRVLKLLACRRLKKKSLEPLYKEDALPSLCELDLSFGTLCQSGIEELLANCTRLTHVSLSGCINMHDLNWDYSDKHHHSPSELPLMYSNNILDPIEQPNRQLKNLSCVGCENMRKVLISPFGSCYSLSSLTLSLSKNLKEVHIVSYNLCLLNLSYCRSLKILKLECAKLSSLLLRYCLLETDVIENAIIGCKMLETLDVVHCPKVSFTCMERFRAARPTLKRIHNNVVPSRSK